MSARDFRPGSSFPSVSYEDWRLVVERELSGAGIETLSARTADGLLVRPLYTRADAPGHEEEGGSFAAYVARLPSEPGLCRARRRHDEPNVDACNARMQDDFAAGIRSFRVELGSARGVRVRRLAEMARLLADLPLVEVEIAFDAEHEALQVAGAFAVVAVERGVDLGDLRGSYGTDPLGSFLRTGILPAGLGRALRETADLGIWATRHAPGMRAITVSGDLYHELGATPVQELAFAIATGVTYVRAMLELGLDVKDAAKRIDFAFAVGEDIFQEIAKLRAARVLWALVLAAFGLEGDGQRLRMHVEGGRRSKTRLDVHTNIVRSSIETFVAHVADADTVAALPFDVAFGQPGATSRRVAWNTPAILREEAHASDVVDPAAGSYYIESLTDVFARRAWSSFQEIERNGGMARAIARGVVSTSVRDAVQKRREAYSMRERPIVGVSVFPQRAAIRAQESKAKDEPKEPLNTVPAPAMEQAASLERLAKAVARDTPAPGTLAEGVRASVGNRAEFSVVAATLRAGRPSLYIEPLESRRDADDWEHLRQRSSSFSDRRGHLPRVWVVTNNDDAAIPDARRWAIELFRTGGFEASEVNAASFPRKGANESETRRPDVICLCTLDRDARVDVERTVAAFGKKGPLIVVLGAFDEAKSPPRTSASVHAVFDRAADPVALFQALYTALGVHA